MTTGQHDPGPPAPSTASLLEREGLALVVLVALTATLGSLFFSEVMGLVPCRFCWFQRILMYPLVIVGAVALLRDDRRAGLYVLPLSLAGIAVAGYHVLLQWGFFTESTACANSGPPCSAIDWIAYGFITIPSLSLTAFLMISLAASASLRQDLEGPRRPQAQRLLLLAGLVLAFYTFLTLAYRA